MVTNVERMCEFCGIGIDGSFATGRFCSRSCACKFGTSMNMEERRRKISRSLKGRLINRGSRKHTEATKAKLSAIAIKRSAMLSFSKPVIIEGDKLDITKAELADYRTRVLVCEICGNECMTGRRLAVDHCHETNTFRGLLCASCNMKLDWYIKNAGSVGAYLRKQIKPGEMA